MSLRREIGQGLAWTRGDSSYGLHPSYYPALKEAWMAGRAFYVGSDLYGAEVVIKLATVEAIALSTPETAALSQADSDDEKNEDMLAGRT